MHRRYFEHLYNEICVALNRRISRYDLWLRVGEGGGDPSALTRAQVRDFVENDLPTLLAEEDTTLSHHAQQRLDRRILRFDPEHPTPEEWLARTFDHPRRVA